MLRNSFWQIRQSLRTAYGANLPKPPRLVKIPLGITDREFSKGDKTIARSRLGIPDDTLLLLHIARFSPRRKTDLSPFLEALAGLRGLNINGQPLPKWKLILAGAGNETELNIVRNIVNELGINREVIIEQDVTHDRKCTMFDAADVFCSMIDNHQETFGITIIEAMAHGLPIIASDFNGYKELIVEGKTGFLITTRNSLYNEPWESMAGLMDSSMLRFYRAQKISFDIDMFVEKMVELMCRKCLRESMGRSALVMAENYRWTAVMNEYNDLWHGLMREARSIPITSRAPLLTPCMDNSFSHYASQFGSISIDSMLGLSEHNNIIMSGLRPIRYDEISTMLNNYYIRFILDKLSARDCLVGELVSDMSDRFGVDGSHIVIQLDWLLKHGMVTVR